MRWNLSSLAHRCPLKVQRRPEAARRRGLGKEPCLLQCGVHLWRRHAGGHHHLLPGSGGVPQRGSSVSEDKSESGPAHGRLALCSWRKQTFICFKQLLKRESKPKRYLWRAALCVCVCVWCRYLPQDGALQSETVHFKRGVCQQFCLPSHTVNLSEWADEEVGWHAHAFTYVRTHTHTDGFWLVPFSCCTTWTGRFSPWWCRRWWTRARVSLCLNSSHCPTADVLVIFSLLLLLEHLGHCHILLATFEKVRAVCRLWYLQKMIEMFCFHVDSFAIVVKILNIYWRIKDPHISVVSSQRIYFYFIQ